MNDTLPIPPNPGSYRGWSELLAMLDRVRQLVHDRSLEPGDAMRRLRDAFVDYDQGGER